MDSGATVTPPYLAGPLRLRPFSALRLATAHAEASLAARNAFRGRYSDVADRLRRWQLEGLIAVDHEPALYLHQYTSGGTTVRGLVGALDVSRRTVSPGEAVVLPHEGVHPAQAEELARRMLEMGLDPAPILLVHRAAADVRRVLAGVREDPPLLDYVDPDGQHHRIWAIRDETELQTLEDGLAQTRSVIADGHHRYAAYLRLHENAPGRSGAAGLAMLVDHDDTPLHLGAIHRVLTGVAVDDLERAARAIGATTDDAATRDTANPGPGELLVVGGDRTCLVRLPGAPTVASVVALHTELLTALAAPPTAIIHHHEAADALVEARRLGALAVLLPRPGVDLVLRIVRSGRVLPEKATSFQPKPSLGVLMRSLPGG